LQHPWQEHACFSEKNNMPRKRKTSDGAELGVRIGRNIKVARTRLGMTQSELAEVLDMENVTISRIETGAQLPSIDRLEAMANALGVSLVSLIADTGKTEAYAEMLAEVMSQLPLREREFVYGFVVSYARHVSATKKK
jgi:transcriptional regulator with XRE-family HTH domain